MNDDLPIRRRPVWRYVQSILEQDIRNGVFAPGDRLPTEGQLAERFGVHRHTVRRAIQRLREKDILRVERGSGMFVREPVVVYSLGRRSRLTTVIADATRTPVRQMLSSVRVRADRRSALALHMREGSLVRRVEMLRLVDDRPIAVSTYFFPLPRFENIHKLIDETGSISVSYRRLGVTEFAKKSVHVRASLPSAKDAALLKISRSSPLIELTGVNVDQDGVPIQWHYSRLISAWLDLVLEFKD